MADADLRPPPAFQEYGGDLLNLERIQLMSLPERGLFATMRWKVWANDSLPRDPAQLARLLGLEVQEVRAALSEAVMQFFAPDPRDSTRVICPELAQQKAKLMDRRIRQSSGGRTGAISKREKGKTAVANLVAMPQGKPQGRPVASEKSRDEKSRDESAGGGQGNCSDEEVLEMRRAFGESV